MMYSVQRTVGAVLKTVLPDARFENFNSGGAPSHTETSGLAASWRCCIATPISREYSANRGTTIDRYYIESFLGRHSDDACDTVFEVHNDTNTQRFGKEGVTRSASSLPVLSLNAALRSIPLKTCLRLSYFCTGSPLKT
jgi:hypothetical protein